MPLSPFSHIFAAVFSSVTMSLLGRTQGNIWLFEDSVLITGKTSGTVNAVKSHFLCSPSSSLFLSLAVNNHVFSNL